jgi:endonuclease-8
VISALGPDLCEPDVDLDEAVRRSEGVAPGTPVGEVLLDQRVACGIGNVFRAEVLWACELDPVTPMARLASPRRRELFEMAGRLLLANLRTPRRRTVPSGLAVYRRAGRACPRCRGTVRVAPMGARARSVWWCPTCQTRP